MTQAPFTRLPGRALTAAATTLALLAATPPALADPIDPADLAGEQHDHAHDAALGLHGDHFGEALVVPEDPFVVDDGPTVGPLAPATHPLEWRGAPPDPDEVPQEWLRSQPAEEIEPSTTEELMSADTGYFAALEEEGGVTVASTHPDEDDEHADDDHATAQGKVPPPPKPEKPLPSTLDATAGWQYTYSCDPTDKPGMVAFAKLMAEHYGQPGYSTSRACIAGDNSQHYEGRADDWGMYVHISEQKEIGDAVAQWLTANNGEIARRFGVMSVIWNRKSWYISAPSRWFDYTGPSPHTDHLHISFTWDGAMGRTSWWTGKALTTVDHGPCRVYSGQYAPRYTGPRTTPCPTDLPEAPESPYPVVLPNARNDYVAIAQDYLGFASAEVDRSFGPKTLSRLLDYQRRHSLPVTGVLDNATWDTMIRLNSPSVPAPKAVDRVTGPNRYGTASALARPYPTSGFAFVTTGQKWPDALAASARAGTLGGPVLLTKQSVLPDRTVNQLERIRPWRIYLVHTAGRVSPEVQAQLEAYAGTGGVVSLSGNDQFETAAAVSGQFGSNVPVAYVTSGTKEPDAIAAAARAGYDEGPVLFTRQDELPESTTQALRQLRPKRIVVVGGEAVVSAAVAKQLGSLTSGTVERVAGENRYQTAAALASSYPTGLETVYLSTGLNFPDALAGGPPASKDEAPMLFTKQDTIPQATLDALEELQPQRVVVLGGTGVVSDQVLHQLRSYVP